jgi:hypothetical protein
MAGSVLLTVPIIVLFFLTERHARGGSDERRREGLSGPARPDPVRLPSIVNETMTLSKCRLVH